MSSEFSSSYTTPIHHPWFDHSIDQIMIYLFQYQCAKIKAQHYDEIVNCFHNLDLAAHYFLFDLIEERLPHRAKMLFSGENYQGKKETILEVMAHIGQTE